MFRIVFRVGMLTALALALGCAKEREAGPKVTGRVLVDGQPGRPVSLYDFDLKFLTVEGVGPGKRSYLAEFKDDGTFVLNGSIGKGIPVGRYKVIFNGKVYDAAGKPTNKYVPVFTEAKTPLEVEITDATKEITVDLEKKTVTAG
ncbi:MAG TPA: hypothetical protein VGF55_28180 [Gemmataceae bacterium]